jgi:xanthosine utilization system XapX-like protein
LIYVLCIVAGLVVGFLLGLWAGVDFAGTQIVDDREREGPL